MTCRTDCGRCIYCTEHDDYGPAWRNPRFREPVSDVEASGALGDGQGAARPSAPVVGRDGGEPVDLLAALARSIEKAKAARRDGGER